jgi:organic hydroperoxide reductase OsmC/OhrA
MDTDHHFAVDLVWTGARGQGTTDHRSYGRDNTVSVPGKPELLGSSARVFHGDADRWNPEELLVAALSECHMLSYLHVAVRNGIVVTHYADAATGILRQQGDGGRFSSVTLRPRVTIVGGDPARAEALHAEASALCFIASSVSFPVTHEPVTVVG